MTERLNDQQQRVREHLHFIYAGGHHNGQPFAVRVEKETLDADGDTVQVESKGHRYYHRDHLGSVIAVTDDLGTIHAADGNVRARLMSFDAFGKRRNADWSTSTPDDERFIDQYSEGTPGNLDYTGHEAVPEVGLIHMNGRMYDPALGRFFGADPFVQAPDNSQSYNRYSYVLNNPLRYNDPSGYTAQTAAGTEDNGSSSYEIPEEYRGYEQVRSIGYPLPPPPLPDYGGVPNWDHVDWGNGWNFNVTTDWGGSGSDLGYYYPPVAPSIDHPTWSKTDFSQSQSVGQGASFNQGSSGLTSGEALQHYKDGSGAAKRISFDQIDTSGVSVTDFKQVRDALSTKEPGTVSIDDRLAFTTSGDNFLMLGNITLRLQGRLSITEEGWGFDGTLKSFDDFYDFNASSHRGIIGELLTTFGRNAEGTPYWIEIRGSKPMTGSGSF